MKITHALSLLAAFALAGVATAKPQDGMDMNKMPARAMGDPMSMEDQDYSAWKDYFFGLERGNQFSMFSSSMMVPKFEGPYDEKVFMYLRRAFVSNESIPARPFDGVLVTRVMDNEDVRWRMYNKLANTYRRELIRENQMRMDMRAMNSGMSSSSWQKKPM